MIKAELIRKEVKGKLRLFKIRFNSNPLLVDDKLREKDFQVWILNDTSTYWKFLSEFDNKEKAENYIKNY
jgi:hypothetical protein